MESSNTEMLHIDLLFVILSMKTAHPKGESNMSGKKNTIVLCGFMSCGKTTIGSRLAEKLGFSFVDTDQLLFQETGKTLQEMFAIGGESYFRDLEHETVCRAAQMENVVISTGGGVMTFERNAKVLYENGYIIHIHRPFENCYANILRRKNRPIAGQKTKEQMLDMYNARVAAYNKYASYVLENDGTP